MSAILFFKRSKGMVVYFADLRILHSFLHLYLVLFLVLCGNLYSKISQAQFWQRCGGSSKIKIHKMTKAEQTPECTRCLLQLRPANKSRNITIFGLKGLSDSSGM